MIKAREAQNFLKNFQTELPESFNAFAELLQELQDGKCQAEDVYQNARELLRPSLSLINYFNKFITPKKQIQVLTKINKEYMIEHLLRTIHNVNPELEKKLSKISIEIGKKKFDDINFYSYEDLSTLYIQALQETQYLECIGRSDFKAIKSILTDFVQNANKEDRNIISIQDDQTEQQMKIENNNFKQQVVISKEDFRKENQLLDLIELILSPEDFEIFLKLFWIYHLNIISYVEFVKSIENILINLDKQTCLALKNAIESREQNRAQKNPFNLKNQLECIQSSNINQSYKKINSDNLQFSQQQDSVINKQYACIPKGHEAFTAEDQASKNQIKNTSEEELLKVEDEIHEFDVTLAQFKIVKKLVQKLQLENLNENQKTQILNKIGSTDIFGYLYGKKAFQIFDIIRENPDEILPILTQRIDERVEMLQSVRENYITNNWQKQMAISYYKALDIKANTTKILERKKLINKNLIKELNDQQLINNRYDSQVNIVNSVTKLLYKKKENFVDMQQQGSFWNPSIIFEIGNKQIMKDICAILQIYSQFIKLNNSQDFQKCQEVIGFFIENFFNVYEDIEDSKKSLQDYFKDLDLENYESLLKECYDIEKFLQDKNEKMQFLYSEKLSPKINNTKIPEMIKTIYELLNMPKEVLIKPNSNLKPEINSPNYPYMNVNKEQNQNEYNVFFGSYQFYILYRYFIFLYERFQFANSHSQQIFQSNKLYKIFKKILVYSIFGVLDTQNFEDLLRIIFGQCCGVFLNFEKIFTNLFKVYKKNIFTDFVIETNWHLVNQPELIPTQELLFALTSFQLHELLNGGSQKNNKNNAINSFNSNYNVTNDEFLKFQFLKKQNLLVVHKVRSIFREDQKLTFDNFEQILKNFKNQIYKISMLTPLEYFSKNQIAFEVRPKRKFDFIQSEQEDITFCIFEKDQVAKEEIIENKNQKFQEIRTFILETLIKQ